MWPHRGSPENMSPDSWDSKSRQKGDYCDSPGHEIGTASVFLVSSKLFTAFSRFSYTFTNMLSLRLLNHTMRWVNFMLCDMYLDNAESTGWNGCFVQIRNITFLDVFYPTVQFFFKRHLKGRKQKQGMMPLATTYDDCLVPPHHQCQPHLGSSWDGLWNRTATPTWP